MRHSFIYLEDKLRQKNILCYVSYPSVSNGKLVILSHGLGFNCCSLSHIADFLSKRGYVCICPTHTGSDNLAINDVQDVLKLNAKEIKDRIMDIKLCMDDVLSYAPMFKKGLSKHDVILIGHCIGGLACLCMSGSELKPKDYVVKLSIENISLSLQYLFYAEIKDHIDHDDRVREVIAINAPFSHILDTSKTHVPILGFTTEKDELFPYEMYPHCPSITALVIVDSSHFIPAKLYKVKDDELIEIRDAMMLKKPLGQMIIMNQSHYEKRSKEINEDIKQKIYEFVKNVNY